MKSTRAVRDDAPLLERERELDAVRDALDRLADGQGSLLLIEGPAGIGKTALLEHVRAAALDRGMQVYAAKGSALERADEAERSRLLSGSAALARIAFGLEDSAQPSGEVDRFAPIHGLYWLLANLCDAQPVQVVIDDAQWADTQSRISVSPEVVLPPMR